MSVQEALSLEGTTLDRKYRIIRVVAEGGFSVVYEGEHASLGIPIAIKVLKSGRLGGSVDDVLRRFGFEAQTVARLNHPDIAKVLDTGVVTTGEPSQTLPWIVLEWLTGETLKQNLVARRGKGGRGPSECLDLLRPVFAAIGHAHAEGIAHRDIKPSNILLARSSRGTFAKVLDFGIAKMVEGDASAGDTATDGSVRAFSPSYAAPEQLAGARTGLWTDVHALSLVMTELLTDEPAYSSEDSVEVGQRVFSRVRPTPKQFGVDVGPWEQILERALSLRTAERQKNATELLGALAGSVSAADAAFVENELADGRSRAERYRESASDGSRIESGFASSGATATYSRTTDEEESPTERRQGLKAAMGLAAATLVVVVVAVWRSAAHRDIASTDVATPSGRRAAAAGSPAPIAALVSAQPVSQQPPPPGASGAVLPAEMGNNRPVRLGTASIAPPTDGRRRLPDHPVASATPSPSPSNKGSLPYVLE